MLPAGRRQDWIKPDSQTRKAAPLLKQRQADNSTCMPTQQYADLRAIFRELTYTSPCVLHEGMAVEDAAFGPA